MEGPESDGPVGLAEDGEGEKGEVEVALSAQILCAVTETLQKPFSRESVMV